MKKIILNGIAAALVVGVTVSAAAIFSGNSEKTASIQGTDVIIEPVIENKETISSSVDSEVNKTEAVRKLETAPECNTADKDTVFHIMLNSIDYFDKVSGTMKFSSDNVNVVNVVEFQSVISKAESYSRFTQCSANNMTELSAGSLKTPEFENIVYCKDGKKIDIYPNSKTYCCEENALITLDDAVPIKDEERISVAEDGMPVYNYRNNPTNVVMSSMCLFPQEITIGFLEDRDLWEIEGVKEFSGLNCYVIHGKTSEDYGAKLNVSEFEFLVDVNTGVLVRYEGFDANGNLSDFMYTENLKFGDPAESVAKYSDKLVEGYSAY